MSHNTEPTKKSEIEELEEVVDNYISKSAELVDESNNAKPTLRPSLSVSEFQTHSQESSIPRTHSQAVADQNKKFYQFLFISLMIGSLSICISLIFHFFELKRNTAKHQAYYKYLHKAIDLKHNNNDTIFSSCLYAIEHVDVITAYKSASIDTRDHKLDMERLENIIETLSKKEIKKDKNESTQYQNKKEELVIMCSIELSAMLTKITSEYNYLHKLQVDELG